MDETTRLLSAIEQRDDQDAERLMPLVYDELQRLATELMAREPPGDALQADDLVDETYLRLVKPTTKAAEH